MEQHEIPSQPKVEFVCGSAPTLNLSIPDLADLDARVRTCVLKGHLAEMYSVDFMWNRDDLQTRLSDDEFDKVQQWKFWDEVGAGDFVENWTQ
jgi:hypothetical protein